MTQRRIPSGAGGGGAAEPPGIHRDAFYSPSIVGATGTPYPTAVSQMYSGSQTALKGNGTRPYIRYDKFTPGYTSYRGAYTRTGGSTTVTWDAPADMWVSAVARPSVLPSS